MHLEDKIRVVGNCHELGKGGPSKYGMVGSLESSYLKVDMLCV